MYLVSYRIEIHFRLETTTSSCIIVCGNTIRRIQKTVGDPSWKKDTIWSKSLPVAVGFSTGLKNQSNIILYYLWTNFGNICLQISTLSFFCRCRKIMKILFLYVLCLSSKNIMHTVFFCKSKVQFQSSLLHQVSALLTWDLFLFDLFGNFAYC